MVDAVLKRDGTSETFDRSKIEEAIEAALGSATAADAETLARRARERIEERGDDVVTAETVQDIVEKILIEAGHQQAATGMHRHGHNLEIEGSGTVESYLGKDDWQVNENSNMSYSLQGLNVHLTEQRVERYWLEEIYPHSVRNAHEEGLLHIHDLGVLGPYCVGWDIADILQEGFRGVRGKIESEPARHFDTALMQLVNFLYTLQGEAAGAQALSNLDTYLAPFVRNDDLSYEEVKHRIQGFVYNLNVPTRVGFQAPFTNVSLDLTVPDHLADEPVVVGGERREETYGEFQPEVDTINRAFAEVMLEGDASGRPFTFPIPTYSITEDFDWENPTLNPVWEMTAKYGIPYFSNFVNSEMDTADARSMCCRLRLDNRELENRGGGLFGSNPLTGSIGVVTVNLPRLGYLSDSESEFYDRLERAMTTARESLEIKRDVLEEYTKRGLYPYSKFYLRAVEQFHGNYWANHFSTIGLLGMNEALLNLLGTTINTAKGKAFAEEVLEFMRDRLRQFQERTGNMYNLEATPAEGSSYRLAKHDREQFPDIAVHATDSLEAKEPVYTNSTQLPFGETGDLFDALDHQDDLQTKYTGGTVFHGWLGERMPSAEATKRLVRAIAENYELPYYTLTPTFSVCPTHGYRSGEHDRCPKCDTDCEVYSRVVGYLRPTEQWNPGKQAEFDRRADFAAELD